MLQAFLYAKQEGFLEVMQLLFVSFVVLLHGLVIV
jgi:hypothetical protein